MSTVEFHQRFTTAPILSGDDQGMIQSTKKSKIVPLTQLETLRKASGLNRAQLAGLIGIAAGFVTMLESGEKGASHTTLLRLAHALGCSIEQLTETPGTYPGELSVFLNHIAPDDITDQEIEILKNSRLPGRRITARAYSNLLDAIRNSEKLHA